MLSLLVPQNSESYYNMGNAAAKRGNGDDWDEVEESEIEKREEEVEKKKQALHKKEEELTKRE